MSDFKFLKPGSIVDADGFPNNPSLTFRVVDFKYIDDIDFSTTHWAYLHKPSVN